MLSDYRVEYVELASIAGMCEHIDPKKITEEYAAEVRQLLNDNHLKCLAVAGHVDLTIEEQLQPFLKKIEFTSRIGAKYINTNSGPLERISTFRDNIKRVISAAEQWNVIVCLESHGDIISTARRSSNIIRELHHPLIRMNYDIGNTFFYEKGKVDLIEDIEAAADILAYCHIKDLSIAGDAVSYKPIGDGDIDFRPFFKKLDSLGICLDASLEIPVFVRGTLEGIGPVNPPLSAQMIKVAIERSLHHLTGVFDSL